MELYIIIFLATLVLISSSVLVIAHFIIEEKKRQIHYYEIWSSIRRRFIRLDHYVYICDDFKEIPLDRPMLGDCDYEVNNYFKSKIIDHISLHECLSGTNKLDPERKRRAIEIIGHSLFCYFTHDLLGRIYAGLVLYEIQESDSLEEEKDLIFNVFFNSVGYTLHTQNKSKSQVQEFLVAVFREIDAFIEKSQNEDEKTHLRYERLKFKKIILDPGFGDLVDKQLI